MAVSSDDILKRVPPQNLEAEQSVLGAILLDNDAINHSLEILSDDDFYRESHRQIFRAMAELTDHSQPVDAITLTDALRTRGVLGAYFILYPRGRILTILPIFVFIQFIEIPAVIYLFVWFAVQLYAGLQQSGRAAVMGGVAWWAHVGGFMFGVAMGPILAINHKTPRRQSR